MNDEVKDFQFIVPRSSFIVSFAHPIVARRIGCSFPAESPAAAST
jgi:hypothetical protein